MGEFSDSPGKRAVREQWNTPLLRYLNQTYGMRFRYMGLPGVDLLDVLLWKDMIEEVVAFERLSQINENDLDGRRDILALRRNLQMLGISGYAYLGPMEEVVIRGEDYESKEYKQNKFITLYNLDFCDEIVSKIDTRNPREKVSRFEAIRQILLDQQHCYKQFGGTGVFLFLLTIRDQIGIMKLKSLLSKNIFYETQSYIDVCSDLHPLPDLGYIQGTHTWALKAFIHDLLLKYLAIPHISAVFFPIVKYTGKTLGSPMLHCMLLCRFEDPQKPSPLYLPIDYLTSTISVRALDNQSLVWEPEPGEYNKISIPPNSEQWLKDLKPAFLRDRGIKAKHTKRQ